MSIITVLNSSDILVKVITAVIPMIINVIINRNDYKNESNVEKIVKCIDDTQKIFLKKMMKKM